MHSGLDAGTWLFVGRVRSKAVPLGSRALRRARKAAGSGQMQGSKRIIMREEAARDKVRVQAVRQVAGLVLIMSAGEVNGRDDCVC